MTHSSEWPSSIPEESRSRLAAAGILPGDPRLKKAWRIVLNVRVCEVLGELREAIESINELDAGPDERALVDLIVGEGQEDEIVRVEEVGTGAPQDEVLSMYPSLRRLLDERVGLEVSRVELQQAVQAITGGGVVVSGDCLVVDTPATKYPVSIAKLVTAGK